MTARVLLACFAALVVAGRVLWEGHADRTGGERPAPMEPLLLPVCIAVMVLLPLLTGRRDAAESLARLFMQVLICLNVYFLVLLCLLPLLRRYVSARTCALLWILPNFLYLAGNLNNLSQRSRPKLLLTLPDMAVQRALAALWLVGFVLVFAGQVLSHLRFRHRLLKQAEWVTDPAIRTAWNRVWQSVNEGEPIPICRSSQVRTPLSVGCFRSTIVLVLPQAEYTPEELELIFRHEARHIRRLDMRTKVFLAFCTALCWFCPLMWLARKRAAEDLELCCDEEVLRDADGETRRQYAELLLRTAGDSRGFSTCLSARARSLRDRLKSVMQPRRKRTGTVSAALAVFLLLAGSGCIAFAEQPTAASEEIFSHLPEHSAVESLSIHQKEGSRSVDLRRKEPLLAYLSGLTVQRVYSDGYGSREDETWITLTWREAESFAYMYLTGESLEVDFSDDGVVGTVSYLIKEPIDWAYVQSLLDG